MKKTLAIAALFAFAATPALAQDFGMEVQNMLSDRSMELFGVGTPLAESAATPGQPHRSPDNAAEDLVTLADGLSVEYLTRDTAHHLDMYDFYPLANPTHIIACIESGREEITDAGKLNPSVQAISLADGAVTTILRGMDRCDGLRSTAWGTVLATEETSDGAAYEIMDPLSLENVVILDRGTGETSDPDHVVKRTALPTMAWEGLTITAEGVVIGGDELRPGTDADDADGGAIFKFIPSAPAMMNMMAESLDDSPFVAGTTYAMRVNCRGDEIQFGQGCEIGNADWVEVEAANARVDADAAGATGYYRPEDLHSDPTYTGEGVRFCFANTGNEGGRNYAEVICGIDVAPMEAPVANADGEIEFTTVVNRFWEGDTEANAFDNLAFQPHTGILYVIEDHQNGDVWACLPDGEDQDIKTDGCVRVVSVVDTSAEPTGFMFSADGTVAYLSIQHSDDENMDDVDDYGTDDFLIIRGFQVPGM